MPNLSDPWVPSKGVKNGSEKNETFIAIQNTSTSIIIFHLNMTLAYIENTTLKVSLLSACLCAVYGRLDQYVVLAANLHRDTNSHAHPWWWRLVFSAA